MNNKAKDIKHTEDFRIINQNINIDDIKYETARKKWEYYSSVLEVAPVPLHVDIEVTNICDLRCVMCERRFMSRPQGMMSFDLFKKIIEECSCIGVDSCKMNLWGESLLHPDLVNMIKYVKDNSNIVTQFNTNANKLNPDKSIELIKAGLDKLTISFDGITKKTYESIRVNGDFNKVLANIESLIQNKIKLSSKTPFLTIQIIRMPENEPELDSFVEYWRDKVDFISVTNIGATAGSSEILSHSLRQRSEKERVSCQQLWQRLSILWDGKVTVCCNDYNGFLTLGNYGESSLTDYWHSKKLNNLRQKHKKHDFSNIICRKCTETFTYFNL